MERIETEILTVDLGWDGYVPENLGMRFVALSRSVERVEIDVPPPECPPPADIQRYLLPKPIIGTNSRKEFEQDLLSIHLDLESTRKLHALGCEPRSAKPTAFFTSALVHVAFFFTLVFFPAPQVAGTFGYAGNVLSATVVSHEELIPQNESPASIDSPASVPAIAKTSKKPKEPAPAPPQKPPDVQEVGPHPTEIAMMEKPETPEKKQENKEFAREIADKKENREGDSLQDSVASMPSTASAERRFVPAAGQGGEVFDSLVLSAIREAVFFPKQAAQERQHGEAVVTFSINQDRSISSLSIRKSSGFTILDEAAIKIVQNASKKFPPLPEGLSKDALHFVVPILFKVKGQ